MLCNIIQLTGTEYLVKLVGEKYLPETTHRIRQFLLWQGLKVYAVVEHKICDYFKKSKAYLYNYLKMNFNINFNSIIFIFN